MSITPQSMRSPISPYEQQSKHPFLSQYPSTPQAEQGVQNHGLGLFSCSVPQSQSTAHHLPPSPQPSESWQQQQQQQQPSMMEQDFPPSSQPPDIFTAAYDPFSGFSAQSNTGMMSAQSPEAPGLVYCQTPPSTNFPSHRSSISSSYSSSEASYHSSSEVMFTPKVKVEEASEWYPSPANEQVLQRSLTTQGMSPYPTGVSPVSAPAEDLYRTQTADWPRPQTSSYPIELHSTEGARRATYENAPVLPSVGRVKKKRQRTTPAEATHECQVCGKLFKRSYNWKSHMETHNPERKYPHPCTAMMGSTPCTKKFQRKTDLDRHYDSVHLKTRNHQCELCGNRFARRDTLRRHTEDGCPKRLELGFREGSGTTPGRWSLTNFPARNRSYSLGVLQPSPLAPPPQSAASANYAHYNRPEFVSSPTMVSPVYAS